MAGDPDIPAEAPPSYQQATGSSSASGAASSSARPASSSLKVPGQDDDKSSIPMSARRSMEDEGRPLPKGWVRTFDPNSKHQFFVDTTKDPPRSIWIHPYDDEEPFTGFYDFSKLNTTEEGRPVLVDVGGADGTTIAKILEAHPDIKPEQCVLEDRDGVIEFAKKNANLTSGVQFVPHDFFKPQPMKNAKAYLLRAVCHDWSDTMVIKILSNIASAMSSDSKVLIADNCLPEGGVQGMAAYMDLLMLCIGGKERTKASFEVVLDAAGLKLDGVYHSGVNSFAIVEASLK